MTKDWIDIAPLFLELASLVVTVWLATNFTQYITRARFSKEYYITELDRVRFEFSDLARRIGLGALSQNEIVAEFKRIKCDLKTIETILKDEYIDIPEISNAQQSIFELQRAITDSIDFNNSYKKEKYEPEGAIQVELIGYRGKVTEELLKSCVTLNNL